MVEGVGQVGVDGGNGGGQVGVGRVGVGQVGVDDGRGGGVEKRK